VIRRLKVRTLAIYSAKQQRFTISEVAADWHELMIPQHITHSITTGLDPRCS